MLIRFACLVLLMGELVIDCDVDRPRGSCMPMVCR